MPSLWKAWIPLHGTHPSHNDLEKPTVFTHSHKADDDGFKYEDKTIKNQVCTLEV